ncbi:hypothetical protein [Sulfuricurvum sp.]|uniref:hypothetical protein n=1 Tax=Sulfuricurvum sp. TaxID=2025608 RepID=UPI002D4AA2F0|nr:hypothetical protein [Sulfuricurvum sp.]HZF70098.1 hypothetical protein [Sulfuricurvum sp.]
MIKIEIIKEIYLILFLKMDERKFYQRYYINSIQIGKVTISIDWSYLVDIAEIFNGFSRNILDSSVKYSPVVGCLFEVAKNEKPPKLRLISYEHDEYDEINQNTFKSYLISKQECLTTYNKLTKILNRSSLISYHEEISYEKIR